VVVTKFSFAWKQLLFIQTTGNPFAASDERRQLVKQVVISLPQSQLVSTYRTAFIPYTSYTCQRDDTTTRHYNFNTFCLSDSCTFVALHLAVRGFIIFWYINEKRNHSNHNRMLQLRTLNDTSPTQAFNMFISK
jgi:hypothetical protein